MVANGIEVRIVDETEELKEVYVVTNQSGVKCRSKSTNFYYTEEENCLPFQFRKKISNQLEPFFSP